MTITFGPSRIYEYVLRVYLLGLWQCGVSYRVPCGPEADAPTTKLRAPNTYVKLDTAQRGLKYMPNKVPIYNAYNQGL